MIIIGSAVLYAQPLPPLGNAGQNPPMGGAAPIDGGLSIILVLSAAYGGKRIHMIRKEHRAQKKVKSE